jgi:hypothetical protein
MTRDPKDRTVFRVLVRGAWGGYDDWAYACRYALERGWTTEEVQSVLFWTHPLMLMIGLVVVGTAAALLLGMAR